MWAFAKRLKLLGVRKQDEPGVKTVKAVVTVGGGPPFFARIQGSESAIHLSNPAGYGGSCGRVASKLPLGTHRSPA